jgi:hypothetical protein
MRILLRAPKDTFDARPPREVLQRNLILGNTGNLLFLGAAQKLLSAPGVAIEPDRARVGVRDAGMINERFDHYVMPLANAFRPFYESSLLQHAALLSRLRIPVTVLGVAAQGSVAGDFARLRPMERAVRAFLRAVLDRGPSIGVRGELTADYVRGLGFRDVEVIGCPSMFAGGPALPAPRVVDLTAEARVAITISPYTRAMAPIVRVNLARYPKLEYIAQDLESVELLLWGVPWKGGRPDDPLPVHPRHPLIEGGRMRLSSRARRWWCCRTTAGPSSWRGISRFPIGRFGRSRRTSIRRRSCRKRTSGRSSPDTRPAGGVLPTTLRAIDSSTSLRIRARQRPSTRRWRAHPTQGR